LFYHGEEEQLILIDYLQEVCRQADLKTAK